VAVVMALGISKIGWSSDHQLLYARELSLPAYQLATLAKDAPITDLRLSSPTNLLMIGQTSLWSWDLASGKLVRTQLVTPSERFASPLRHIGSDGLNDFVSSDNKLFELAWTSGRILRFDIAEPDRALGFAGEGDNFWLIKAHHIFRIDRYTKAVLARYDYNISDVTKYVFDPQSRRLWYLAQREVRYIALDGPDRQSHVSAKLRSMGLDLQMTKHELVALSASALIRLSFAGKPLQSVPVEGRRKLHNMALNDVSHAYLFDDGNLEIYNVPLKSTSAAQIPSDLVANTSLMRFDRDVLAILAAGSPRVFRLSVDKLGDE